MWKLLHCLQWLNCTTQTHTHTLALNLPTFLHPFFSFHAYHLSPPFFPTNTIPLFLHLHTRLRAHTGNSAGIWPKTRGISTMRALLTECELLFMREHTHTHANTQKRADTHINTLPPQLLSPERFSDLEDPETPSAQWRLALCLHWNPSLHFSNLVSSAASRHVLTIYGDRREAHTAEQRIYFTLHHWIVQPLRHTVADANVENDISSKTFKRSLSCQNTCFIMIENYTCQKAYDHTFLNLDPSVKS